MLHVLEHTLKDGLKLFPFLFLSFLIIELLEHKFSNKTKNIISKSGNPITGSILGAIPQCGFSVVATNLYITRVITLGTLISIYLSTSDEMLPILISNNVEFALILKILLIKIIIGMLIGFIIDFVFRKKEAEKFSICDCDHCHCKESILISSLKHTIKTLIFILLITFIINFILEYYHIDIDHINTFGPFLASLVGLIPNCASSVILTELYLNNVLSLGSMIAGLLTNSGIALIVLFRENDLKDNLKIVLILYLVGVLSGIIINLF